MPTRPAISLVRDKAGAAAAVFTAALTFCSGLVAAQAPALTAIAAVVPSGVTLAAGRTPGTFGVTQSGAASYRIPLWTPPGVGDVELDLALVYNSRGGNGTLGIGWSLSGLSTITRCNRTVAQDGAAGGVTLTMVDRFCLDGRQLKLVSGSYGTPGSVYATEVETFSRLVANGASGYGPESFTVTGRNGLVYEYGGTPDSRINAGPGNATVRTWALSRIRDRAAVSNGNAIAFGYVNDGQAGTYSHGTFRIATIDYPKTASGAGPFYQVRFGYSARPATDVPVGYLAGSVLREPNQLDTISMHTYGVAAPIKSYYLTYDTSPRTGRIRLKSVQECGATSCFRPTQIEYQAGAIGWQSLRDLGATAATSEPPVVADLDGDGLSDVLYPVNAGSGKLAWWLARSTKTGFAAPFATGLVTTSTTSTLLTGDFVGNGGTQLLVQQGGIWYVAGYSGGAFATRSTGLVAGGEYGAADFDGDGLADLVAVTNTAPKTITIRRNTTAPAPGSLVATFAATPQTVWTVPSNRTLRGWNNPRTPDLNGDGRADIAILTTNQLERLARYYVLPLLSNGFGSPFTAGSERQLMLDSMVVTADWNADGCSDVMQVHKVLVSNCAGGFSEIPTSPTPPTGDGLYTVLPADWNGDGRADLLYVDSATREWFVVASTGEGAAAPVPTGVAAPNASAWFAHDADGDGLVDLGIRASDGKLRYRPNASALVHPDLATTFTDAFGVRFKPGYVSMARSHHVRESAARYPEADFQAPLYVVSDYQASDGAGGTYRHQFSYAGARRHLQGRGFLGFGSQRVVDERTGLVTVDAFERSFPYTGAHVLRTVLRADGTTPVSQWSATLQQQVVGAAGIQQRRFPFVASTNLRSHEVGGTLDGGLITESTTTYAYADTFGNPTRVETTVTDRDPTSPFTGSTWRSTATYSYGNDASSNWCLGLPSVSTVTSTAPGQAAMTRKTSFVADTGACRVTRQVLEPDIPALKVTTNYGYDTCGNLNSVSVVGAGPDGALLPARTTMLSHGARCQLPEIVTNALGQTTQIQYRYDFGTPTRTVDPNGLATTWSHDEFGRRTLEVRPDQTRRAWAYESCGAVACSGSADLRFAVHESRLATDGTLVRSRRMSYDGLERLRFVHYDRARGSWTGVERRYDASGRQVYVSRPYSTASNGHTVVAYDPIGRAVEASDFDAASAFVRSTGFTYAGRTTSVRDPLGRSRTEIRDVAGRLRQVKDPTSVRPTKYDYDSHGNLVRIEDARQAVSTGQYNVHGFRMGWNDAAAGSWTYTPNSLNELVGWRDAKGQSFSATYDPLGRLVSRTEPEGISTFTWGASAASRNIGRLVSKTAPGYGESYAYDAVGRPASRTIVSDQTYQYDYTYNSIGELDTLTYPASPVPTGQSQARLKLQYRYVVGELAQIDDLTTGRTLWRLDATNDDHSPTRETVAGGAAVLASDYDRATAMPLARRSGTAANPTLHQDLRYEWDVADNLKLRRDAKQNRTEKFQYDALNRLTGSSLDDVADSSITYDADGSILYKSDVGSYVYGDASQPQRLTAAGAEAFIYDANGNVVSRGGLAQQWASFNLPTLVRKAGYQAQFAYGPDHERWRQVATYAHGSETTHYAGELLEKESISSTGLTYWRHYVPTPGGSTVVISRNSDNKSSTTYVLPDHLGSSDTLLDANGALYARLSFDAFGNRRGSDWRRTTAPDWTGITNITRQGFTAHEMIDNVGLVHMGGRVYDPKLGRFLSVDPVIGDLADSQSVHPYAYAGNRPLNSIDPTGLAFDGPCGGVCISIVASVAKSAMGFLFGGGQIWQPGATAIPGPSAQGEAEICGPGNYSAACTGMVLYAGAPGLGSGPGTSSWVTSPEEDPYAQENLERFFIDLGLNAIDVLILSPINDARDGIQAARRGEYGAAIVILSLTACEVAKPCYALTAPLRGINRASRALSPGTRTVIGRVKDLQRLPVGEQSLLDRLTPNLGSPKANWKRNAGVLRDEMRKGRPIRDASPNDGKGQFLNAERALLRDRGWRFDETTDLWMPPTQ
jgi:RHS repeat-associated protein